MQLVEQEPEPNTDPSQAGQRDSAHQASHTQTSVSPAATPSNAPQSPAGGETRNEEQYEWHKVITSTVEVVGLLVLITYTVFSCLQWLQIRWTNRLTREALNSSNDTLQRTLDKMQAQIEATNRLHGETKRQANEAKRFADIAEKTLMESKAQFVRSERPYIWHDTLQLDDSSPLFVGERVYYTNYGKSPALSFSSTGHVFCGKDALPEAYRYLDKIKKERVWDSKNTVEPPSISQGLPAPNRGYDTFVTDPQPALIRQLCAGPDPALPRVTVGAWEYYDLAGNRYYGEFCNGVHLGIKRGYDASGNCDEHNKLE